jgi:hypothetical protein
MFHINNYLSFYWCDYLKTVKTEYWSGARRKRVLQLGKFTVWIVKHREANDTTN